MQNHYNDLKPIAEMMYPDPAVEELKAIADKMRLSERLVDMNQVMELTTLSRRTLLNLEARGEFPERVQVTEGRKAWYLSEVIDWINNIPRASEYAAYLSQKSQMRRYASRLSVYVAMHGMVAIS